MATETTTAWVLNLDADLELADPRGYEPTRAVRAFVARFAPMAARTLLSAGDVLIGEGDVLPTDLRGIPGRAFCPTPRALRRLREAGAVPQPVPELEVLRSVNHRRFCMDLGETLPGARFLEDGAAVLAHLAAPPPVGTAWLLKRPFAVAGRGQRRVTTLDEGARRWIAATLRQGHGVAVEPWVEIEVEWVVHGHVDRRGEVRTAPPRVQVTEAGAWIETRPPRAGELSNEEHRALSDQVHAVGRALFAAGYFGPYGIDAHRWRDARGHAHLQPRSEINARYTMGWDVPRSG